MSLVRVGLALFVVGVTAYGVRRWWRKREEKQRERNARRMYGDYR